MPDRKQLFGCTKKAKKYVECELHEGKEYFYWNCPIQFIPKGIWQFMKIYKYQKDFPSAGMPSYKNVNPKFIDAINYLENKVNEYLLNKDK
jgi:hypothetical protein